jgi:hypothetical protein
MTSEESTNARKLKGLWPLNELITMTSIYLAAYLAMNLTPSHQINELTEIETALQMSCRTQ